MSKDNLKPAPFKSHSKVEIMRLIFYTAGKQLCCQQWDLHPYAPGQSRTAYAILTYGAFAPLRPNDKKMKITSE